MPRFYRVVLGLFALGLLTAIGAAWVRDLDPGAESRGAILGELLSVPAPGLPGCVAVFGEQAEAVLSFEREGGLRTVLAAARTPGGGRVVAFGHDGFLAEAGLGREDGARLVEQAIRWAGAGRGRTGADAALVGANSRAAGGAGPKVFLVSASGSAKVLEARGLEVEVLRRVEPREGVILLGRVQLDGAEEQALWEHLERGGGLLCAATGWGWQQLHPGGDIARDLSLNRVVQSAGLSFTGASADGRNGSFEVAEGRRTAERLEAHAGRLLTALETGELDRRAAGAARGALVDAATAVPRDEPIFGARVAVLASGRLEAWRQGLAQPLSPEPLDGLTVALVTRSSERGPVEEVAALPGIETFPGVVEGDEPHEIALELPPGPRGWRSLGLWVPAGLAVSVHADPLPEGARWRIGAHTDHLWGKARWKRWPEVSRSFAGDAERIASPWGGLLYLELERANSAPIQLCIEGVLEAPLLRSGASAGDLAAFQAQLDAQPEHALAPWVELVGEHVILTLPLDAARTCADPQAVIAYWDRVWELHSALLGRPIDDRPERFVFDVEISAGWMHSGYPIMAHLASAREALDLETLQRDGNWGLFHELGHNSQEREWTASSMGEVTCNLFSLQAMEQITGAPTREVAWSKDLLPWLSEFRLRVAAGEAGFEDLSNDPGHMLAPFIELRLAFGWEPFSAFFQEHRQARAGHDPREIGTPAGPDRDQAVLDQWAERLSLLTGQNLVPYLRSCDWPISPGVADRSSHLPAFVPLADSAPGGTHESR